MIWLSEEDMIFAWFMWSWELLIATSSLKIFYGTHLQIFLLPFTKGRETSKSINYLSYEQHPLEWEVSHIISSRKIMIP